VTISSQTRTAGPFTCNGSTTSFPFSFKVFLATDIVVVLRTDLTGAESNLVLGSDYTVALNADQNANPGGTINTIGAFASGFTLTATSNLAYLQPTDLTNQGGFYPKVITNALDRLTIFVQQLAQRLGRALVFPISDGPLDGTLPATNFRKGRVLAFHETTGLPVAGPTIADTGTVSGIAADIAAVAAIAADVSIAADNVADITNFSDVYLGPRSVDPATRTDGSPLVRGDLYFNTNTDRLRVYTGARWSEANTGAVSVQSFLGDGATVDFALSAAPDNENVVQVFIGGVYQSKSVYSMTGAGSNVITFSSPPPDGVSIEAVTFSVLPLGVVDASQVQMPGGGTLDSLSFAAWATPSKYGAPLHPADAATQLANLFANEQFILIDKHYVSSACIRPKSDQVIWFAGNGRLDAKAKVGGGMSNDYGGVLAQLMLAGVSNVTVVEPHLDGQCDAEFGGRIITGDAQEKPHGVLVLPGCDNIKIIRPRTFNIANFACIHLSNGALGQSKNILFDNPTGNYCGGGVGVEILFAGVPDGSGLYGSSPGRTVINNPVYTATHYPSYYAGCEDLEVNGGLLQSSRLQPLTLYTGDAQGVLNAVINGGVYDSSLVTDVTAPQPLLIRSVNIAPENALYYKKASRLKVVMNGVRFKNLTSGSSSEVFDGCDVTMNDVKFEGGKLVLAAELGDAVGVVTKPLKISGEMKGFSGKGIIAFWDIDQHHFEYDSSVAGNNDCLWLISATAKAYLHRVSFGLADNVSSTIRHGVELDNANVITASALSFNGTGAQYSALESNTYNVSSISSVPPHPFDIAMVRMRTTIPFHTPTGSQPRTVIHSDATSGEPTYWYYNGSSWVGMANLP
jgi:hypothetical protein